MTMKIKSILKQYKVLFALGAFVFCLTAVLAHATNQDLSSGPTVGETLDLTSFRSRSGRTLAETLKVRSLAMIVVVDPNCATCTPLKDSLRALRDRVEASKIPYFVLMIPDGSETQKYFSYADSLNLDAESFVWSNADAKPPTSLLTITKPSHFQITAEGIVVEKWPGIPQKDSAP
jgi:hypothetical protein